MKSLTCFDSKRDFARIKKYRPGFPKSPGKTAASAASKNAGSLSFPGSASISVPAWLQVLLLLALLQITSTYDPLNRLSTMQDQTAAEVTANTAGRITSYGYDLNGNIVQKTLPNGDSETTSFDVLNRATIQSAQTGGAVSLYTYNYGYDLGGNVTSEAETYPSGLNNRTVTNTYDAINRLHIEASPPPPTSRPLTDTMPRIIARPKR